MKLAALLGGLAHLGGDGVVVVGVELREGEVLELALDLPDAEPVRQRRVDVEGLARDAQAPLLVVRRHGAHVVQAVAELDEHHPDVLGHGDEHLADVLGLGLLARVDVDLAELGDPVDELGDVGAELLAQLLAGDLRVLDGVVEQRGDQRVGVEAEVGEDAGDGHRVGDVGLAAEPRLPLVGALGERVGAPEHVSLLLAEVRGLGEEFVDRHLPDHGTPDQPNSNSAAEPGASAVSTRAPSARRARPARRTPGTARRRRCGRRGGCGPSAHAPRPSPRSRIRARLQNGPLANTGRSANAADQLVERWRRRRCARRASRCARARMADLGLVEHALQPRARGRPAAPALCSPSTRRTTVTLPSARSLAPDGDAQRHPAQLPVRELLAGTHAVAAVDAEPHLGAGLALQPRARRPRPAAPTPRRCCA